MISLSLSNQINFKSRSDQSKPVTPAQQSKGNNHTVLGLVNKATPAAHTTFEWQAVSTACLHFLLLLLLSLLPFCLLRFQGRKLSIPGFSPRITSSCPFSLLVQYSKTISPNRVRDFYGRYG